jgi:hypothetical protein
MSSHLPWFATPSLSVFKNGETIEKPAEAGFKDKTLGVGR